MIEKMVNPKTLSFFLLHLVFVLFVVEVGSAQNLSPNFYKNKCPKMEDIVKRTTASFISRAPSLAAALLRMHFHDCFVRGCDGSVLINSRNGNQAEKDAIPNLSLRGFQVIDAVKSALEKECKGVVSCADILALVARDAVTMINGPSWAVPLGRRDGKVSLASDANNNLPAPFSNFTDLQTSFAAVGLNVKDLAVLSGGHTIGISHCPPFSSRLYNFTGKGDTDPNMDQKYIAELKKNKCTSAGDTTSIVEMDPGSAKIFDTSYYSLVSKRRGLFESDAALLTNSVTKAYVQQQLNPSTATFFEDFADSMVKMGKIGVLTGKAGEIRKICSRIN
ncbi:PREDICTED: peroxidase 27-like [Ipomoea nil]|uniref:peroxidase 27-like n=1 Tax=Ipomoea nil TaxID=35883 RepID=UPI0009010D82|nr:PREDICTED: peroxidase 27-like [Ipomoea nil]